MSFEPKQMEMICLDDLVPQNHIYRKFLTLWDLSKTELELEKLEQDSDKGYRQILHVSVLTPAVR